MRTNVVVGTVGFLASVTSILTWAGLTMASSSGSAGSSYPSYPTYPRASTGESTASSTPISTSSTSVVCAIRDRLGDDQLSDAVSVTIGGRRMRTLTVSTSAPVDTLKLRARTAGYLTYSLVSRTTVDGIYGRQTHTGYGTGRFYCRAGAVYDVMYDTGDDNWVLTLVPPQ